MLPPLPELTFATQSRHELPLVLGVLLLPSLLEEAKQTPMAKQTRFDVLLPCHLKLSSVAKQLAVRRLYPSFSDFFCTQVELCAQGQVTRCKTSFAPFQNLYVPAPNK